MFAFHCPFVGDLQDILDSWLHQEPSLRHGVTNAASLVSSACLWLDWYDEPEEEEEGGRETESSFNSLKRLQLAMFIALLEVHSKDLQALNTFAVLK